MPSENRTTLNSKKPEIPKEPEIVESVKKPIIIDIPKEKSIVISEPDQGPKEKSALYK